MEEKEFPIRSGQNARKMLDEPGATFYSIGDEVSVMDAACQARLSAVLENTSDLIATATPDAKLTYLNPAGRTIVGWDREESLDDRVIADLHPVWALEKIETEGLPTAVKTGSWEGETALLHRDGHEITVSQVILAHRSTDGTIQYLSSIMRNITERNLAEIVLRESEDKYRRLIETTGTGFVILDNQGFVIDANQEYIHLTGRQKMEDVLGHNVLEWTAPHDLERNATEVRRCIDQGFVRNLEIDYVIPSGQFIPIEINATVFRSSETFQILTLCREITERKQTDEYRKTHIRFLESLDQVDLAIKQEINIEQLLSNITKVVFSLFDCDRAWLFYPCDPDAPSFRVPVEICKPEYPGANVHDIDIPMSPDLAQNLREALISVEPVTYTVGTDKTINNLTAEQFGVQSQMLVPLFPKLGKPWVFGMHQCSYARIWTEEEKKLFTEIARRVSDGLSSVLFLRELQENENRLKLALLGADLGTWDWHVPSGNLIINERWASILGFTTEEIEPHIRSWEALVHPDDISQVTKALHDHCEGNTEKYETEHRLRHKSGDWIWVLDKGRIIERDAQGQPVRACGTHLDISKRKKAEEERDKLQGQLIQAQKMESVGRLAGGVAHDFNNMLSVILGYTEIALNETAPSSSLHHNLQKVLDAAERSANITRQLLAFARKQPIAPKVLVLNNIIEQGMLQMLRRLIGEAIDLAWIPKGNLWAVKIDSSQIDQILANLCINARDAINGVGKITIETGKIVLDELYCANHPGATPGDYVSLVVSDDGYGIDKESQGKLFEPFYTTKELGKGTGLGLATVYGIVKQNNGFIKVDSAPGQGTTFTIYLPRHKDNAEQQQNDPSTTASRGHETILLVEDEQVILEMTTFMLQQQGYTVLPAAKPGEAIKLASKHQSKIHLLMTDVIMPEMNGLDLAIRLSSLFPDIKLLFMSGYTADIIAQHGILDEGVHFIQKPFMKNDLTTKVRLALEQE